MRPERPTTFGKRPGDRLSDSLYIGVVGTALVRLGGTSLFDFQASLGSLQFSGTRGAVLVGDGEGWTLSGGAVKLGVLSFSGDSI